jgi:hypothetical protein
MWVVNADGVVGICFEKKTAGVAACEVHKIDPVGGESAELIPWVAGEWSQARRDQIPECRRPDVGVAIKFSYAVTAEEMDEFMAARLAVRKAAAIKEAEAALEAAKQGD